MRHNLVSGPIVKRTMLKRIAQFHKSNHSIIQKNSSNIDLDLYICTSKKREHYNMVLLKGILMGIIASVPLGPIAIMVIQRTVNKNFKSGLISALGATTADTLYAILAGFSLSYIISFIRDYQTILQIFGGIVLLFLGIYVFRKNPIRSLRKYRKQGSNYYQDYFSTLLIVMSNPLIIMAYIALFAGTGIAFSLENILDTLQMVLGFALGAISWWVTLTSVVNLIRKQFNLHILWWFNKISGSIIIVFVITSAILIITKGNPSL